MKELLGSKGSGLAEMARLGLRVPAGFTVSTRCCERYEQSGMDFVRRELWEEVLDGVAFIEKTTKRTVFRSGCSLVAAPPLLLSVRSGAAASMPGQMDTVLNLGMNDECAQACVNAGFDARWVYDSYRRLISMFGDVVEHLPKQDFERALTKAKETNNARYDTELDAEALKLLCGEFKDIYAKHGKVFEQDAMKQLEQSVVAVLESWNTPRAVEYREINRITGLRGTAVNVQQMVFGNINDNSGAGVCFTRKEKTSSRACGHRWG
jgi:pyruvate,orthophosphate dikinase